MDIYILEKDDGRMVRGYLRQTLGVSSTLLKNLKNAEDGIVLNGKRVTVRAVLHTGDLLSVKLEEELDDESPIEPVDLPCELLYEDGSIALFRKPSGLPTHPSRLHRQDTLANAAAFRFRDEKPFVFRVVTRLDADVSGAVLISRNKYCSAKLADAVATGKIEKTYLAICDGIPAKREGSVVGYVRRTSNSIITRELTDTPDVGKLTRTGWRVLAAANGRSLIAVTPYTGRTHQIRLALRSLGCPIAGDGFYGDEASAPRCMLHAYRLHFSHPADGREMTLTAPLYNDMKDMIRTQFGEVNYG